MIKSKDTVGIELLKLRYLCNNLQLENRKFICNGVRSKFLPRASGRSGKTDFFLIASYCHHGINGNNISPDRFDMTEKIERDYVQSVADLLETECGNKLIGNSLYG